MTSKLNTPMLKWASYMTNLDYFFTPYMTPLLLCIDATLSEEMICTDYINMTPTFNGKKRKAYYVTSNYCIINTMKFLVPAKWTKVYSFFLNWQGKFNSREHMHFWSETNL